MHEDVKYILSYYIINIKDLDYSFVINYVIWFCNIESSKDSLLNILCNYFSFRF